MESRFLTIQRLGLKTFFALYILSWQCNFCGPTMTLRYCPIYGDGGYTVFIIVNLDYGLFDMGKLKVDQIGISDPSFQLTNQPLCIIQTTIPHPDHLSQLTINRSTHSQPHIAQPNPSTCALFRFQNHPPQKSPPPTPNKHGPKIHR